VLRKLTDFCRAHYNRLTPGLIIISSVIALSLFVLVMSLHAGLNSYRDYQYARQNELKNHIADHIMLLASITAIERGVTATALGHEQNNSTPTMPVNRIRADVDAAHDTLSLLMHDLDANTAITYTYNRVYIEYEKLRHARERIDHGFKEPSTQISLNEWVQIVAHHNDALDQLRNVMFADSKWNNNLILLNSTIRHLIWTASEYAGMERGILTYHINRHLPLSRELVGELNTYRGIVEHHLNDLFDTIALLDTSPSIQHAADDIKKTFLNDFQKVRLDVYATAAQGNYPLSGDEWMQVSTHAINSILNMSRSVTNESTQITGEFRQASFHALVQHLVLIGITFLLMLISIIKVRQSANLLTREKELAEITLHSIGDAVITTDRHGNVEYLNPVAEEYTGWNNANAKGRHIHEVFNIVHGFTREPADNPIMQCLAENRVVGLGSNSVLLSRNGNEYHVEDSAAPIHDSRKNVVGAVMVFYDISSSATRSHLFAHYATHDALTGLANRREFERLLTELLTRAHRDKEQHAFCYIDLDQFKIVNDTCGHIVGDKLLRQLTWLLQQQTRNSDKLARLGGDEFGLLLENCELDRAHKIAEQLRDVVHNFRFTWEDKIFEIGCSIGLVPITTDTVSPAEALAEADAACYVAKEKGRNRVQIYQPDNIELARRHGEMQWVSRLKQALDENRLLLYVQDIQPLDTSHQPHREVLIRLQERDGGIIPPNSFIPAAERYNMMPAIDRWVITNTFRIMQAHNSHEKDIVYNINLSGTSITDNDKLFEFIIQQYKLYQIKPQQVCFEITETAAVQNLSSAVKLIQSLKAEGFYFALDDFGSGLSSFMYLKNLPVDHLKINGSFVRDMTRNKIDFAMVQSINNIGHVLGLKTIAEFVESDEIIELLKNLGVDYAQGYAISRPEPLT
jgi:diguanylate cyclase (GGDEF)-like protein/PAS domain S-box-containing protein